MKHKCGKKIYLQFYFSLEERNLKIFFQHQRSDERVTVNLSGRFHDIGKYLTLNGTVRIISSERQIREHF